MDLDQLRAFVAVVDHGTFEAAARALHLTPSAVSQRIKVLETSAGTVLLQRTKPVQPTARGTALLRSARQLAHLADETAQLLRADGALASGRVRIPIVVNADSIATWFADALAVVATAGDVELEVRRDDEHVSADLLRSGEVMGAVTTEPVPVQGCAVRRLGTLTYRAKASRSFSRRWFPDGPDPDRLALAPIVQFDRKDRMQSGLLERLGVTQAPPQTFVPDSAQFVGAVRRGVGWGMVPDLQDPRGTLVTLDPGWVTPVTLHWQVWRVASRALDAVTAAVVGAATSQLDQV
ncbi:LysR family transcriptional regulator ArgP [Intrasporangium sp.]|uniref:LysR family transcriptional regulator ArgP n=1 Tax=Intrasporangium sp. TaxID=1925024 RepID=UPI0029396750|nr:LysR family transcriptional regulator ArgP [Intrasporangium sp.]MDV3220564.1 LysR family transcriptional regulator ArgP [Intrasporangium sp.]